MRLAMDRNERHLEIVRQTAEILASGSKLSEAFERFCLMLAKFIEASVVFVAIKRADGLYIEYEYDHGESRHPHRRVNPEAQTQRVADSGQPIFIRSLHELRGPIIPLKKDDDSNSAIFVPLRFGAETIGVLSVQTADECSYSPDDLHLVQTCALYVAVSVQAEKVRSENELLQSVASRDALTGVASRRTFDLRLHEDWMRAQREDGVLSVIVLDVDWFKRFNDTYGHVAGDACLNQVAQAAQSCIVRESDLFARYGGEEFAGILWSTEAAGAAVVAERILNAVRALDVPHAESPLGRVTTSIGVAGAKALSISDPQSLVKAADRALYVAKSAGRDRIHVDALGGQSLAPRQPMVRSNIRNHADSLLGRTTEIAALTEAIKRSRIVSIVAESGIGKTRIAVAAAQRRLYAYPDGTWLIDCSAIADGDRLDEAVLGSLGIPQHRDGAPRPALLAGLANKNLLVIFDDCGRIGPHVRALAEDLSENAPNVAVVATANAPLGAAGEEIFALGPPSQADALALFVDRAQAASADFEIGEGFGNTILRICESLANVPLAIELTAPRVAAMSLEEVEASIGRDRSLATIDGAIAWSYRLLSESARRLFERLSVFPSVFRADAARDICSGGDLDPWDVPDALDELARANLVKKYDLRENARYLLADRSREYGREVLRERLERTAVQWRYIRYFRALARRIAAAFESGKTENGVEDLNADLESVIGALEYALVRRVDVAAGADIVVAMRRFWTETGRLSEGRYWTELALGRGLPEGDLRAQLLYAAALMAHYTGDVIRLATLSEELVSYYEYRDDPDALAKSLNGLANARVRLGDAASGRRLYRRALEAYRQAKNRRGTALVLLNLGSLAADAEGDTGTASTLMLEALGIFRELGASAQTAATLAELATCAAADGEFVRALEYANEALIIYERLGNQAAAGGQLLTIAQARIERGELEAAREALAGAHQRLRREPAISGIVRFFEVGFLYACEEGLFELAARVLGFSDELRARQQMPRPASSLPATARRAERLRQRLDGQFEHYYGLGRAGELAALERALDAALSKAG